MSRTDAHRPWRVQQADPWERHRWYKGDDGTLWPTYQACGCRLCHRHWDSEGPQRDRRDAKARIRRDPEDA